MTDFQALVDEFLINEYETSPVMATTLGLTQYDERLDDLSAAAFRSGTRMRRIGWRASKRPHTRLSRRLTR